MEQILTFRLLGKSYSFQVDSDIGSAKGVVDYLSSEVAKVESQLVGQAGYVTGDTVLVLAALNIVNEYFTMKKENAEFLAKIKHRSESLLNTFKQIIA